MDIGKRISFFRESKGYSVNKLATLSGISQSYLRDVELGKKNPTVEIISCLCASLDISLKDFFDVEMERTFFDDPLVKQIYHLTSTQRKALMAFLDSMTAEWVWPHSKVSLSAVRPFICLIHLIFLTLQLLHLICISRCLLPSAVEASQLHPLELPWKKILAFYSVLVTHFKNLSNLPLCSARIFISLPIVTMKLILVPGTQKSLLKRWTSFHCVISFALIIVTEH